MVCTKCGHSDMTAVKEPTHGLNFRVKSWVCSKCGHCKMAHTKEDLNQWEKDFSIEIRKDKKKKKTDYTFRTLIDTEKRITQGDDNCSCDGNCGDDCKCKDSPSSSGGCGGCGGH